MYFPIMATSPTKFIADLVAQQPRTSVVQPLPAVQGDCVIPSPLSA